MVCLLTSCGDTNKNSENQTESEATEIEETETGILDEFETGTSQETENDQGNSNEEETKRMEEVIFFNGPMQIWFYGDNMYSSRYYYEYDETTESDSLFAFYLKLTNQYVLRGEEFLEMFLQRDGVLILPEWSDFENNVYCFACTMEDYRLYFDDPEPEFKYIHHQYFAPLSRPDFKEIRNQIDPEAGDASDGEWYEKNSARYHEVAGTENHLSFVVEVKSLAEEEQKVTLDSVKNVINEEKDFEKILATLEEIQYPDYVGGSGLSIIEYWLQPDGKEVIRIVYEFEAIYHEVYDENGEVISHEKLFDGLETGN